MASKFVRVSTQFIAALGDPKATSGVWASSWGIWRVDPGPRGIHISDWPLLKAMEENLLWDGVLTRMIGGWKSMGS